MNLARQAKRSDPLGRYYTDTHIGQRLVMAMNISCPKTVIELGAGSGVLVREAAKVWKKSNFFTVDIDGNALSASFPYTLGKKFKHSTADALDQALAEKLGVGWAKADAAICNPPYLLPKWKIHFEEILEEAGLRQFAPKKGDIPADLLFIAQNLRMLKNGGKLGLILPDGIIAGEKYRPLRKALINMHCIEKVIELPRRTFSNTDAKTHILVLSKNLNSNESIFISRINRDGSVSEEIKLPTENFTKRLDYSYVKGTKKFRGKRKVSEVVETIFRGSISSVERKSILCPVFHTTDFSAADMNVPSNFYITQGQASSYPGRLATTGDILVARVGRNLSSKICMVRERGFVPISDCILALRVNGSVRDELFNFLRSERGTHSIETGTKGVGAKFITADSLGEIKF